MTDRPPGVQPGAAPADEPWREPGAEPFIRVRGLRKQFGDEVAVDGVDLDIYQGELFSILGGSGCGKTTLLRMLAGFEQPGAGVITIDGVDVTDMPPYERPVNMMFQSYALFPHMSVADNVAYGLRKEGVARAEVGRRVTEMLEMVRLADFARRRPAQLSGGQRQRVALARALVKRPKVLLLDEPLAALDKKLREHTLFELMSIQYELGITFVVVTHDQQEAMTLSTRIAVMNAGAFVQIGTPNEVYEYPCSRAVAEFVGSINLFEGRAGALRDGFLEVRCADIGQVVSVECATPVAEGSRVWVALRPEKLVVSKEAPPTDGCSMSGVVWDLGYQGNLSVYRVKLGSGKIVEVSTQNRRRAARRVLEWDAVVHLSWDPCAAILLVE
ncbi:MAG: ABC transporter ATP-binding protein [Gammaproteobacteria bacterium]|nr:ABC transporter ATP-binding protein [Gammaproteobacteria bacterium]